MKPASLEETRGSELSESFAERFENLAMSELRLPPSALRILMMGTGPFAVPTFRALLDSQHDILSLVTRPDRLQHRREKSPVNPMRALFWSAVINGVVAVPLLVVVILLVSNRKVMGDFTARAPIRWLGWATVALMAAAAGAMVVPLL